MSRNKPIPTVGVSQEGAVTQVNSDGPLKILFTSDVHFDSPHCNRDQFFADLDYAKQIGALVVIVGDFFDAMQGRFDPRRDMQSIRPEYRTEAYYDAIVEDAVRQLKPWRRSILMATPGNHELSVLKNANTDIMTRFVRGLSIPTHTIYSGGYGGIINLQANGMWFPTKYFHGAGGEAPVTKGVIQTNRQATYLANFVLVINGHNHNAYYLPIVRETVNEQGTHKFITQHHVRTPGYMQSYGDGTAGWEVTRGGVPKPIGSFVIEFGVSEERPMLITPHITVPIPHSSEVDIYDGPVYPQE